MRHYLPELVALPLLPVLLLQGRRTRRITPRLREATGPSQGIAGQSRPGSALRILAVGESPVAGVGVDTHAQAVTACFAEALSASTGRPVAWQAAGRNGAVARDAIRELLPSIPSKQMDIVLLCFGVNDTTAFAPATRWKNDMQAVIDLVRERFTPQLVLLSGVPPMQHFPALPQPLRWVLGMKAAVLDRTASALAAGSATLLHVPLAIDPRTPGMMAHDGYHPSAAGCIAWAGVLADLCQGRFS
jgi:lysophospholipase L1-like esterase